MKSYFLGVTLALVSACSTSLPQSQEIMRPIEEYSTIDETSRQVSSIRETLEQDGPAGSFIIGQTQFAFLNLDINRDNMEELLISISKENSRVQFVDMFPYGTVDSAQYCEQGTCVEHPFQQKIYEQTVRIVYDMTQLRGVSVQAMQSLEEAIFETTSE